MRKKRLLRNRRALSPVFSTILLIVIVVIGMTVAFAFFVNYVRDYQTGSGSSVLEAAQIEDVSFRHVNPNDVTSPVTSYVDGIGGHTNFAAQQSLGGATDTLTEYNAGLLPYFPSTRNLFGSTTDVSGSLADLQSDNGAYMQFRSYPSAYSGSSNLGYTSVGGSSQTIENRITGSQFTLSIGGQAQSISAYIDITSQIFGYDDTEYSTASIENTIRGARFQPSYDGVATSITAYIDVSSLSGRLAKVKSAIYSDAHVLLADTEEKLVSTDGWVTFNLLSPLSVTSGTNYILVAWSDLGTGSVSVRYHDGSSSTQGHYLSGTYGSWPAPSASFSHEDREYSIYCTYQPSAKVKAAIYSDAHALIASTEEKTVTPATAGWVTFNLQSPQALAAGNYILVAWSSSADSVNMRYHSGSSSQGHYLSRTYDGSYPSSAGFSHESREYSIYCTIGVPSEYTCEVEFTGSSSTSPWVQLSWTVDSAWTTGSVPVTLQLFDYSIGPSGAYPTSSDGYISYTSSATPNTDETKSNTITVNPTNFRDPSGNWKLKIKGVKTTPTQFDLKVDLIEYKAGSNNYVLELPEQWTSADYNELNEELWIYTGTLSPNENLLVQVWAGSEWNTLMTLTAANSNSANQVSVSNYLSGSTFTIRFKDANDNADETPSSWEIDYVMLHTWSQEGNTMEIWLYNYGKIDMTISNVYINDLLVDSTSPTIQIGNHTKLIAYSPNTWAPNTNYHIRIITERGSAFEGEYVSPVHNEVKKCSESNS